MGDAREITVDMMRQSLSCTVVVPQEIETEAIQRAWQKVHDEDRTRKAIQAGMKATAAYKKSGVL